MSLQNVKQNYLYKFKGWKIKNPTLNLHYLFTINFLEIVFPSIFADKR